MRPSSGPSASRLGESFGLRAIDSIISAVPAIRAAIMALPLLGSVMPSVNCGAPSQSPTPTASTGDWTCVEGEPQYTGVIHASGGGGCKGGRSDTDITPPAGICEPSPSESPTEQETPTASPSSTTNTPTTAVTPSASETSGTPTGSPSPAPTNTVAPTRTESVTPTVTVTQMLTPTPVNNDQDNDGFDNSSDCDDKDDQQYPGADEIQNNEDDDCDGGVDEGFSTEEPTDPATDTPTPTPTVLPSPTTTETPTATATLAEPTSAETPSSSETSGTPTQSGPTDTETAAPTPTAADTQTPTPTATDTQTPTPTAADTQTPTPTAADTQTPTPTATFISTATVAPTPTALATGTPTSTPAAPTPSASSTPTVSIYSGNLSTFADDHIVEVSVNDELKVARSETGAIYIQSFDKNLTIIGLDLNHGSEKTQLFDTSPNDPNHIRLAVTGIRSNKPVVYSLDIDSSAQLSFVSKRFEVSADAGFGRKVFVNNSTTDHLILGNQELYKFNPINGTALIESTNQFPYADVLAAGVIKQDGNFGLLVPADNHTVLFFELNSALDEMDFSPSAAAITFEIDPSLVIKSVNYHGDGLLTFVVEDDQGMTEIITYQVNGSELLVDLSVESVLTPYNGFDWVQFPELMCRQQGDLTGDGTGDVLIGANYIDAEYERTLSSLAMYDGQTVLSSGNPHYTGYTVEVPAGEAQFRDCALGGKSFGFVSQDGVPYFSDETGSSARQMAVPSYTMVVDIDGQRAKR